MNKTIAAALAVVTIAAINVPVEAQTPAELARLQQLQLQNLRRQQQAELQRLRQEQLQQRTNSRVYNNGWGGGWGWGSSIERRKAALRSQIGNTMDAGVKANLIMELKRLEGRL